MESSIAEFLERQLACELLPTVTSGLLSLHCKEKFVCQGIKKATMHSKRWEARAYMCTWLEQPYTSSVVSVLISVTTDMSPTGDLLVTSIFAGEVSSRACSGAFMCCAGMALSQWQHTLWGNRKIDI